MKNIIITILAILVIGLGGFIVYDKLIDKKVEKENPTTNDSESNKISVSIPEVITGYSKKTYYTVNGQRVSLSCDPSIEAYISVDVPEINVDRNGAKAVNKEIKEKMTHYIDLTNKTDFSDISLKNYKAENITYSTLIKDDILYIFINSHAKNCASYYGDSLTFMYDYINDKQLFTEDVLNKYGISLENLKNQFTDEDFSNSMIANNESIKEAFDKASLNDFTIEDIGKDYITVKFRVDTVKISIVN